MPGSLTVSEVARALAVSPKTVRRRIASGELAAVRLGRGPRAPVRGSNPALERFFAVLDEAEGSDA